MNVYDQDLISYDTMNVCGGYEIQVVFSIVKLKRLGSVLHVTSFCSSVAI